jgi:hypothetical protein
VSISESNVCPQGHYCPQGSTAPTPCPPGTNSTSLGLRSLEGCVACPKKFYCPDSGTVLATLKCPVGYFCPGNVAYPAENSSYVCPVGHRCPAGSDFPVPCAAGQFQDRRGNDTCKACPNGYFCEVGCSEPILCPSGYYCPENSLYARDFPCPAGTYNPLEGLQSEAACIACAEGHYCESRGLSAPTGECDPGYYCGKGSNTKSPQNESFGGLCTAGHFCPKGSAAPTPCPPGTNSSSTGISAAEGCASCLKGYYCPQSGTIQATQLCLAGYFCPGGVANPAANDSFVCPVGFMCPLGSDFPIPCASGTYQDQRGNDTCKMCPAGYYCDSNLNTSVPQVCPVGYYCPAGSKFSSEHACPKGTFSNRTNLKAAADCTPCSAGYYCNSTALTLVSGPCAAGYYCSGGSTSRTPFDAGGYQVSYTGETCVAVTNRSANNMCPPG